MSSGIQCDVLRCFVANNMKQLLNVQDTSIQRSFITDHLLRLSTNLQITAAQNKRARELDLEGLDMSNVIEGSRRRGRTEAFTPQQPKRRRAGPSAPSDSEDPEDIDSDDGNDSEKSDGTGSDSDSASEFEFELSGS